MVCIKSMLSSDSEKQIQGISDLLTDPVYIVTAILVYFLCYGMVISGIVEYLISPEFAFCCIWAAAYGAGANYYA